MLTLAQLGYGPDLAAHLDALGDPLLEPARVAVAHGQLLKLFTGHGPADAVLSGRFHDGGAPLPTAGDWVAVTPGQPARVEHVLPPRTELVRQAAGARTHAQRLAANVDVVFVVTSANQEFKARRLERYLAAVTASGARCVLVLNKVDLCEDVAPLLEALDSLAPGVPAVPVSALTDERLDALRAHLAPNTTVVLVGSSGVGKSTLVNRLAGEPLLETKTLSGDRDQGRHTTTRRQLVPVPLEDGGVALLLDTPGLRELALWADEASVRSVFPDVEALAPGCRFADCTHTHEPGCAVRAAVEDGALDAARVDSHHKLLREQARQLARQDVHQRLEAKRREKEFGRLVKSLDRVHPKRRR